MSVRRHIKFPATPRFSGVYKQVLQNTHGDGRLAYANYDPSLGEKPTEEQIEKLQNYKPVLPVLTFVGSEKLHGENMAICYSDNELWVQGRNQVRTVLSDQNGMAKFVEEREQVILSMIMAFALAHDINTTTHTIVFDCEWAGGKPKVPEVPKHALTDEETIRLTDLANKVTPVWRITQGITESGATEMKHLGALIGWVIQDIKKEESEEIVSELKVMGRFISNIIKDYYFNYLKGY